MATKRSIVDNARRGLAPPPRAWSIETGQCSGTRPPLGAVSPSRKRDHEAARSNRRDAPSSVPVTSQWHAHEGAGQAARYTMTSPSRRQHSRGSSHEGARDCSRAPGVMATTLRANAQELQVSTTVEENARDTPRPAWGSRAASSPRHATIATAGEGIASIRASEEQNRSRHHSWPTPHRVEGRAG